jgi:hypothetical protein
MSTSKPAEIRTRFIPITNLGLGFEGGTRGTRPPTEQISYKLTERGFRRMRAHAHTHTHRQTDRQAGRQAGRGLSLRHVGYN